MKSEAIPAAKGRYGDRSYRMQPPNLRRHCCGSKVVFAHMTKGAPKLACRSRFLHFYGELLELEA